MHLNVHSSIIYNCQDIEATYMFINRWMGTKDVECVCVYLLLSICPPSPSMWDVTEVTWHA